VNRLREPRPDDNGQSRPARREESALVPVDLERRALELRIEHAKNRIVEDLNRASAQVREAAATTFRRLGTLAVIAGVVLASVVAGVLFRWSRRARIDWR
jgi:hypothetical protein